MKRAYVPAAFFGMSCACFLAYVVFSASQLPERVATHFDLAGRADGWMTRTSHLTLIAVSGLGVSLFLVGLFFALRFFPREAFNIPRRNYWLAPERRADTFAYLLRQSFWLSTMMVGFFAGIHCLTIQANRHGGAMARLSMPLVLALAGCLIAGTVVWAMRLIRHLR